MRGVLHHGGGLPVLNCFRRVIRPAAPPAIFPILAVETREFPRVARESRYRQRRGFGSYACGPRNSRVIQVGPREFRLADGDGDLECPLEGRDYGVWELPPCLLQKDGRRDWWRGVRLGPDEDSSRSRRADPALATPPGVRATSEGEIIAFSQADGQVGFPPVISTDASPGYSATAYQSSNILFGNLEGGNIALVLEGTTSRCHNGGKTELARRATVRDCPCCTAATHVAIPAPYEAGEFSNEGDRALEFRKNLGPWVDRRHVAYFLLRTFGSPSKSRRRVAQSLHLAAPSLVARSNLPCMCRRRSRRSLWVLGGVQAPPFLP